MLLSAHQRADCLVRGVVGVPEPCNNTSSLYRLRGREGGECWQSLPVHLLALLIE